MSDDSPSPLEPLLIEIEIEKEKQYERFTHLLFKINRVVYLVALVLFLVFNIPGESLGKTLLVAFMMGLLIPLAGGLFLFVLCHLLAFMFKIGSGNFSNRFWRFFWMLAIPAQILGWFLFLTSF